MKTWQINVSCVIALLSFFIFLMNEINIIAQRKIQQKEQATIQADTICRPNTPLLKFLFKLPCIKIGEQTWKLKLRQRQAQT